MYVYYIIGTILDEINFCKEIKKFISKIENSRFFQHIYSKRFMIGNFKYV